MNDQQKSQTPPLDLPLEADKELDKDLDQGELSQKPLEPKTEPELRVESQNKIEANFQIAVDIRNKAIEQGAVSRDDSDHFMIIEGAPKAQDILSEFKKITQELKEGQDSEDEKTSQRQLQAELTLAFAYNTVALLHKYYKEKMRKDILAISAAINQPTKLSKEQVHKVFEEKIGGMGKIAADLESFHASIEHLVPELVKQFPQLQTSCDEKNAQLLTFLGRQNKLKSHSYQSAQELERFVDDLQGTISLSRIHNITLVFEALYDRQYPKNDEETDQADAPTSEQVLPTSLPGQDTEDNQTQPNDDNIAVQADEKLVEILDEVRPQVDDKTAE